MFKTTLTALALFLALSAQGAKTPAFDFAQCMRLLEGPVGSVQPLLDAAHTQMPVMMRELSDLIRIDSVSPINPRDPDPKRREKLEKAAARVQSFFRKVVGVTDVRQIQIGEGFPYVVAQSSVFSPAKPTVILYAHYDVMPGDGIWTVTQPFVPLFENSRLYGRGSGDNKGGVVLIGAALKPFLDLQLDLPFNFRVIIDGEEEIGSPGFRDFAVQHPELFRGADMVLIPDGANLKEETPTVTTSLRGTLKIKARVRTADRPSHSGLLGGPIPDPRTAITLVTADLINRRDGSLNVPALYENLIAPTSTELATIARMPNDAADFRVRAGLVESARLLSRGVFPISAQIAREPSLGIVAIDGAERNGFAVQPFAEVELAVRVPPGHTPAKVFAELEKTYRTNLAQLDWGVVLESFEKIASTEPWIADAEDPVLQLTGRSLFKGFAGPEETLFMGSGGTVGLMDILAMATEGAPSLLLGIDDPDTGLHSINENLHLATFEGDRNGLIYLLHSLAKARARR